MSAVNTKKVALDDISDLFAYILKWWGANDTFTAQDVEMAINRLVQRVRMNTTSCPMMPLPLILVELIISRYPIKNSAVFVELEIPPHGKFTVFKGSALEVYHSRKPTIVDWLRHMGCSKDGIDTVLKSFEKPDCNRTNMSEPRPTADACDAKDLLTFWNTFQQYAGQREDMTTAEKDRFNAEKKILDHFINTMKTLPSIVSDMVATPEESCWRKIGNKLASLIKSDTQQKIEDLIKQAEEDKKKSPGAPVPMPRKIQHGSHTATVWTAIYQPSKVTTSFGGASGKKTTVKPHPSQNKQKKQLKTIKKDHKQV